MPAGDRCGAKFRPFETVLISGMELFLISGVVTKKPKMSQKVLKFLVAEHVAR
jgi:hypothetical protein